jgi:hypothetical protein
MSMVDFGSCCNNLKAAMTEVPSSAFRVEDSGVLYLTVGRVDTDEGPAFFDQAVLFCPFCGTSLQTAESIALRTAQKA